MIQPQALWARSRNVLKTGWLISAGLVALYVGWVQAGQHQRGVASQRATGLAVPTETDRIALWKQPSSFFSANSNATLYQQGIVGGFAAKGEQVAATLDADKADAERKLVRTASLNLVVKSPAQVAEKIIELAQNAGGFLVSSQVNGGADALSASLTVRIPAAKFDEVRKQIRDLGSQIDSENIESQDVTRQYVDEDARLRNLRAQEQQYLGLLRKAATVKDTLEVSEKLNEVREEIEQKQAEFETLSKQVETVAFNIALRAEADAQVFGLHWRPLYQLKMAAREGLDGFGDYIASMTQFAFFLPTVLLWLFTILVGAAIGWRILKWSARILFRSRKAEPATGAVA